MGNKSRTFLPLHTTPSVPLDPCQNMNSNGTESGMAERLLKTPQIAERAEVSPTTVKRWRQAGYDPPWIRLRGERGEVRYPESQFDRWVQENLNSSLADEYHRRPQDALENDTEAPTVTISAKPSSKGFSMQSGSMRTLQGDE